MSVLQNDRALEHVLECRGVGVWYLGLCRGISKRLSGKHPNNIPEKPQKSMSQLVTLRPGARGTIRLVQQYGKKLICVRYRYNPETRKRVKTIELIVDEKKWTPARKSGTAECKIAEP